MSGSHAFLACSFADTWVYCAGAPMLAQQYPEDETQDTLEGEAAHWIVSSVLESYLPESIEPLGIANSMVGQEAPNGILIDEDMVDAARVMIDDVLRVAQEYGCLGNLHIEEHIGGGIFNDLNDGTPDCWVFVPDVNLLILWDFKYGHGGVPGDSWQNKNYIAGILKKIDVPDTSITVTMAVVQPRCYDGKGPIKRVTTLASDLRADFNLMEAQANKALTVDPGVTSGNHCHYCPARHSCSAAQHAAMKAVDVSKSSIPVELSNDGISFELSLLSRAIKAMQDRYDAVYTLGEARAKSGQRIPGYSLESSTGNRRFEGDVDKIIFTGTQLGLKMTQAPKLITPTQLDKQLKELGVDGTVITEYIKRPNKGVKLTPFNFEETIKGFKS